MPTNADGLFRARRRQAELETALATYWQALADQAYGQGHLPKAAAYQERAVIAADRAARLGTDPVPTAAWFSRS